MKTIYPFLFLFLLFSSSMAQKKMPDFLSRLNKTKLEKISVKGINDFYLSGSSFAANLSLEAIWVSVGHLKSSTVYIELINPATKTIEAKEVIRIDSSSADFTLNIPTKLQTGVYQIRAYTNWMRNFSPEHFYTKEVSVFSRNYKSERPEIISKVKVGSIYVYPEGGHILVNQHSKISIETKSNYGKGTPSSYWLLNSKNDTISSGQTNQEGRAEIDLFLLKNENYHILSGDKTYPLNPLIKDENKLALGPLKASFRTSIFLLNYNMPIGDTYLALFQDGFVRYWKRVSGKKKNAVFSIPKFESDGRVDCFLINQSGEVLSSLSYFNLAENNLVRQAEKNFDMQFSPPVHQAFTNKEFEFTTENGLSVSGKILKENGKVIKRPVDIGVGLTSVDSSFADQFYPTKLEGYFTLNNLNFSGDAWLSFATPFYKIELDTVKSTPAISVPIYEADWSLIYKPSSKPTIDSLELVVLEQIRKDNELILLDEVSVKARKLEEKDQFGNVPTKIIDPAFISRYQNTGSLVSDLIDIHCKGIQQTKGVIKVFLDNMEIPIGTTRSMASYDIKKLYIMKYAEATSYNCSCAILITTAPSIDRSSFERNQRFLLKGYQNK